MKARYVIVSPPYQQSSAGIRVLHRLWQDLLEHGYQAKITNYIIPVDDTDIVVYPEIYKGNPLKAKTVVRFVLYYPGVIGGDKEYDPSELIFTYRDEYYPGAPMLTTPIMEDFFTDYGLERKGACFWVGKGAHIPRIKETEGIPEITREWPSERRDLAKLFNSVETFYTYDVSTMLIPEAQKCGCNVVVVHGEIMSDYDTVTRDYSKQLDNFIRITQDGATKNTSKLTQGTCDK